jgi:hypothetical protein
VVQGLLVPPRRRLTPGAVYVAGVGLLAVLLLGLAASGLMDARGVALVAVPLGPIGVVAAVAALPLLTTPLPPALAVLVLAAVLAVAAVNVLLGALLASVARRSRGDLGHGAVS